MADLPPPQTTSMGKGIDEVITDEVSPEVPPTDERDGEAAARRETWDHAEGESVI